MVCTGIFLLKVAHNTSLINKIISLFGRYNLSSSSMVLGPCAAARGHAIVILPTTGAPESSAALRGHRPRRSSWGSRPCGVCLLGLMPSKIRKKEAPSGVLGWCRCGLRSAQHHVVLRRTLATYWRLTCARCLLQTHVHLGRHTCALTWTAAEVALSTFKNALLALLVRWVARLLPWAGLELHWSSLGAVPLLSAYDPNMYPNSLTQISIFFSIAPMYTLVVSWHVGHVRLLSVAPWAWDRQVGAARHKGHRDAPILSLLQLFARAVGCGVKNPLHPKQVKL